MRLYVGIVLPLPLGLPSHYATLRVLLRKPPPLLLMLLLHVSRIYGSCLSSAPIAVAIECPMLELILAPLQIPFHWDVAYDEFFP
mmetsp:Transcript_8398/g.30964  ORF Transcript_8398/g.30964 Transcript_8398/m.30964 type:complete len:85 (+) Transcript_8398:174-428(+)